MTEDPTSLQEITIMRKTSIIMGLALALSLGAAGVASAQGATRAERPRAAQDSSFRRGRGGPNGMLLRGITLSAEQKTRVAELRASQRKQFDAMRDKAKENGSARQRGDTTGFGARRAQMTQRRDQNIAAMRSILNAQQRTQFDKNVAELKTRAAKHEHKGGNGRRQGDSNQTR
jgi:hypothetical protein